MSTRQEEKIQIELEKAWDEACRELRSLGLEFVEEYSCGDGYAGTQEEVDRNVSRYNIVDRKDLEHATITGMLEHYIGVFGEDENASPDVKITLDKAWKKLGYE